MKRIYSILLGLLLLASLQGQILRYSHYTAPPPPAGVDSAGWEAEYKAIYYEMTTPSGIDTADWQNTLVKTLKTAGVWSKGDVIYLTAVRLEGDAYRNWADVGNHNLTDPGSKTPVFTKYQGITGNIVGQDYLSTNYNVKDDSVNAGKNDLTLAVYQRLVRDGTVTEIALGAQSDVIFYSYIKPFEESYMYGVLNSNSTTNSNNRKDSSGSQGLFTAVRRSDTAVELYKNKTSLGDLTQSSTTLVSLDFYLLTRNYEDAPGTGFSANQISFVFIGGALSDAEQEDLYDAVQAYMTLIGGNV